MKWFFIGALITLAFSGCKKEKMKDPLTGKWELRHLKGGIAAPGEISYPAGNGTIITFTGPTYESYWLNQFNYHGTYSKTRGYCYATGREMDAFVIENGKTFYEFSGDTLVLYIGVIAADGAIEKFVRLH